MATAGALTLSQWLAIIGAICAVVGLVVNIIHKRKMYLLAQDELRLKERELSLKYNGEAT
ncbi:MAG: phage holin family protein [Pelagimonas sp.]|nr:phage holin family protein [Pelagimonas sp.]